jgi:hypothetical protein
MVYSEAKRRYGRSPKGLARGRANQVASRLRLKILVMKAYGGKCKCCKEKDIRFLTMDHMEGGGAKHFKAIGGNHKFYRWLRDHKFPKEFQVLCFNCNTGRSINKGICPHKDPL